MGLTFLIAAIGIAATWLGWSPLWWQLPAFTLATLILFEFRETRASTLHMALSQPARIGLGSSHRALLTLRNDGTLRHHLKFCPAPPDGVTVARRDCVTELVPGASATEEFPVSGSILGVHEWPRQPVEIRGRLGLARWIRHVPLVAASRVVPNVQLVQTVSRGLSEAGQRLHLRAGSAGEETWGLRQYAAGDPPSAIAWKTTARQRELMVWITTNTQHLEMVVAIDAGRTSGLSCGNLTMLGHSANVAARLLTTAELRGDRTGLLVYADRVLSSLPLGHGPSHQRRLQNMLAATVTSRDESNPLPAIVELSRLAQRRSLVVLFCQLHDAEANGQLLRAIRLLRPKHLPLIVALRDPEIDALSSKPATHWSDPYTSLAAMEYQRDVRAVKQRLQRLGADVIEATPNDISNAVLQRFQQLRKLRRI